MTAHCVHGIKSQSEHIGKPCHFFFLARGAKCGHLLSLHCKFCMSAQRVCRENNAAAAERCVCAGYAHRRALGFREGLSDAQNSEVRGRSRAFIFHVFKTRH